MNFRKLYAEKKRKFRSARNAENADTLGVNFRLRSKPTERSLKIFQRNAMQPSRQRRNPEICQCQGCKTMAGEHGRFVEIETAACAAENHNGRMRSAARWNE